MNILDGHISLDSPEFLVVFSQKPSMTDRIHIPLYGKGEVVGLNDNYAGTDQTWVMVKWEDGRSSQFQYVIDNQG